MSRWQEIEELFQRVVDLTPEARRDALARFSGDPEVVAEVQKLLADYDDAGEFIESPVWTDSVMLGKTARVRIGESLDGEIRDDAGSLIGSRIGAYRLTAELGRGGMGAVYLAERDDGEFRRRVALKVIKRGMDTDFIVRRFRNERQILAALDHPNIARLLDGGTTDDGLPFFVMEFIEGLPLYRYCDEKRLTVNERLALFRQVCFAVDYAHKNLIVHRDIKPSNILVTSDGQPKLLDFGIAKILNPELAADSIDPTATAMRMMTPEYASPEQVRGEPVTLASDIYSLGVLLYELLTGHRPYRLKHRAIHEIARVVCEEEPDPMRTSLTRDDNLVPTGSNGNEISPEQVYRYRKSDPESLRRELSGDVEKIVLKALRKNPRERYLSAVGLADDIEHFLENRPVTAEDYYASSVPAGRSRQSEAETGIRIAVLPLKLLAAGPREDTGDEFLGIGLADALITRLSNIRRLTVRPTSSVLRFNSIDSDPFEAGRELGVDFILDGNIRRSGDRLRITLQFLNMRENAASWAESFDERFSDVLTIEDSISERVVNSLVPQLTGDEEYRLRKRGTNSPQAYEAQLRGRFYWTQFTPDALEKARRSFEEAIRLDPNFAIAYVGLADTYIWITIYGLLPPREALRLAEDAANRAHEIDPNLGDPLATLALIAQNRCEWARSESLSLRAIELNPNYAQVHEWYGATMIGMGRTEEGLRESALAERLDSLSPRTKTLFAWALYQGHRFAEAIAKAREILELEPDYPQAFMQLGIAYLALGEKAEALRNLERFAGAIPGSAISMYAMCFGLKAVGREDEARSLVEEMKRLPQPAKPYFLGMAHVAIGEIDEAFGFFRTAMEEHEPWMLWFGTEPMLKPLHGDPRFLQILREMRNPLAERGTTGEPFDESEKVSIAVLPLKILHPGGTGDPNEEFLGIGLADALINRLSGVRRLIVRPTTSVIRFGAQSDALEAAARLNVEFVVDGSMRRAGSRVRVSIQMLSAASRTAVWARSFDEEMTDVLALEDSIANQLAEALVMKLTRDEKRRLGNRVRTSPEAYEAYLRGRFHWHRYTADGLAASLVAFYEAIALDPNFAPPYSGVADYYNFLAIFGIMAPKETFPAAKEAALKAIEIDEELDEAYTSLGVIAFGYDWDFAAAENYLKKAVELNPSSSEARNWFGQLYSIRGEHERAIAELRKAEELNPDSASLAVASAIVLRNARRYDEGIAKLRRGLELDPSNPTVLAGFSWFTKQVEPGEAVEKCRRAVEISDRQSLPLYAYAYSLAAAGRISEAREAAAELDARRSNQFVPAIFSAVIATELGDLDGAIGWLERAVDEKDFWAIYVPVDSRFDELRDDPRYAALMERIGFEPKPADEDSIHQSQVATRIFGDAHVTADQNPQTTGTPPPASFPRRIAYAAAILGIALLAVVAYRFFSSPEPRVLVWRSGSEPVVTIGPVKTLAVLPFKTDLHVPSEGELGLGLAESIYRKLGQAKGLSVRPAMLATTGDQSPMELGRTFGVGYVLRGTLHAAGERVDVTAELVATETGKVEWSQRFDEKLTDLPVLQVRIADQVLNALTVAVTSAERAQIDKTYTENSEAYQLYLAGRYLMANRSTENLRKAVVTFEKSREKDPGFALAYAGLADAWSLLNLYQVPPPVEGYGVAKQNALKALELDDNLAEAHASLGYILLYGEYRRTEAIEELWRATELNPSYSTAHHWSGLAFAALARHEEAVASINKAMELEPRSAIIYTAAALIYNYARRHDEAIGFARKALEINPALVPAHKSLRIIYSATGNYAEALSAYEKERLYSGSTEANDPGWLMITAQVQAVGGQRDEAAANLRKSETAPIVKNNARAYADEMAMAYALLGDADNAVRWLAKAREVRSYSLNFAAVEPRYDKIKNDPRFVELTRLER